MKNTSNSVQEARDYLAAQTVDECARMIAGGMRCISPENLKAEIGALGYKINPVDSFNYINTGNEVSYYARAVAIVEKLSGHCFSNVASNKDNLPALQAIRFNTFCFENGRIWEI